jgi:hypothetical protein
MLKIKSDNGSLPVFEIITLLALVLTIFGLGLPYIFSEKYKAQESVSRLDASAVTVEIESVLRELGSWSAAPVTFTWNSQSQILSIPNPGGNPPIITRSLPLSPGTRLLTAADGGPNTNKIIGRNLYCIGVENGSAKFYKNENGPTTGCP